VKVHGPRQSEHQAMAKAVPRFPFFNLVEAGGLRKGKVRTPRK